MDHLTLNLLEGSISFKFSPEAARSLKSEIDQLLGRLKAIANQGTRGSKKPEPQPAMEYRHAGEVFVEVFCNPNIYPSPFAAKVLLTIRDERLRLTAEAELTRLVDDLSQYLEQQG
jgi:hypothetical protein